MHCRGVHAVPVVVSQVSTAACTVASHGRVILCCSTQDGLDDGSAAGAIVIGQKEMFQAVSECLTKVGVAQDRILTNF